LCSPAASPARHRHRAAGPKSLDASGRQQGPLIIDGAILHGDTQAINPKISRALK
jgi:hypothetical protein